MIANDCAVQLAAQEPRLVTRLGLAARLELVLELPNKHVHQVLVDHLCSREGSTGAGILTGAKPYRSYTIPGTGHIELAVM